MSSASLELTAFLVMLGYSAALLYAAAVVLLEIHRWFR